MSDLPSAKVSLLSARTDTSKSQSAADGDVRQAVLCVLAAMTVIGVIDNYVGLVAEEGASLWQFHAIRTVMALPLLALVAAMGVGRVAPRRWRHVVIRSLLAATAMMFYFGSLGFLPFAAAVAGLFSSPIWIVLISVLFLGARIGPVRLAAVALGFAGVLMVLQPSSDALGVTLVFPMLAGVFYALSALYTRRVCGGEDAMALLAGNFVALGLMGAAGSVVFAGQEGGYITGGWGVMTPTLWTLMAVQAVGSLIGVWLIIRAYLLAAPAIVGVLEYAVMIIGPAYAWIVLGQGLNGLAIAGLVAITGAAVLITLRGRA